MEGKYKRLIRDMCIFALGMLGSKLITFLLLPLYTHILTTDEYGVADLIFTLGQLVLPFISLTIFNGLLRYGLMKDVKPEDALRCATRVFLLGSIAMVLVTPLLGFVPSIGEWRWFLCAYVISTFSVSNTLVYLKIKDKNTLYSVLSILQTLVLVICNLLLLVEVNLGIRGYLWSYIISNCITALCAVILGGMLKDFKTAKYRSDLMKAMILFSLPYIINDISWWAINSVNKLIIEFMMSSAILGVFTAASKIPSLINALSSIFTQAWGLSSIKEYDSSNDTTFYEKVYNYYIIFIFGVCIAANTIMKPFMSIYVSDDFFVAWHYVPLLLLGAAFSGLASFMGALLGAVKKSKTLMTSAMLASVVNVVMGIVLIKWVGLWGAAIATLVSYVVVAVYRMVAVRRYIVFDYHIKKFVALFVITLTHAVLVGLDFYIVLVSIVSVFAYIICINKDIRKLFKLIRKPKNINK